MDDKLRTYWPHARCLALVWIGAWFAFSAVDRKFSIGRPSWLEVDALTAATAVVFFVAAWMARPRACAGNGSCRRILDKF